MLYVPCVYIGLLLKMPLVTSYQHLQKRSLGEAAFFQFVPLRAVGLSVELCWKLSRDKGFGSLGASQLRQVEVGGELKVLSDDRWHKTRSCTLQLALRDAALALAVVKKQGAMLGDLGINVWQVDTRPQGGTRTFDLLCSFTAGRKNYGVTGKLWIELKVVSAHRFDEDVAAWKNQLQLALPEEHERDCDLNGVLLLVAKVEKGAGGQWLAPELSATLKALSAASWQHLAGGSQRASRGQCKTTKPPLQTVLGNMEWLLSDTGTRVGLLRHFLGAFGLPVNNAGQRAATMNTLLQKGGFEGRVKEVKLANKTGRKPWVASKETFRALYKHL